MNIRAVVAALSLTLTPLVAARAQGVTTGAVSGRVRDEAGMRIEGATITVVNTATGASSRATAARVGRLGVRGVGGGGGEGVAGGGRGCAGWHCRAEGWP